MTTRPVPIVLKSCPKVATRDLDKAATPAQTIERALAALGSDIFGGTRRIDSGRLGIPVYLGLCGPEARKIMPTRKQMGKGSSPEQARASAIMEFVERYSFFSFWLRREGFFRTRWSEAEKIFGADLIPISEIARSVNDTLPEAEARRFLDLTEWDFYGATDLASGKIVWLPLDWFRMLGEFNGSSAGNTSEESLLQGLCELVERHVCAIADRDRPDLPTINADDCRDPALAALLAAFKDNGIRLVLKDMSQGMPLPTVGALAFDESTFPQSSEIVFTAGTATSPVKAAIRAITEVAQLGGDFHTNSCYEASGLPKFTSLGEIDWLMRGPTVPLGTLPDASSDDIRTELASAAIKLAPFHIYGVETTEPRLGLCAHYCIGPGLQFRERDRNQSLGLFIGRRLVEDAPLAEAEAGLAMIAQAYPGAHFLPFFEGMLALRRESYPEAASRFDAALPLQPDPDSASLAAFYAGHALTLAGRWPEAATRLKLALEKNPGMAEAANLLGVCHFKSGSYGDAEECFDKALKIDKGMAMALANRGLARKFQAKTDLAIEDLAQAVSLDPELEFAAQHLAELTGKE